MAHLKCSYSNVPSMDAISENIHDAVAEAAATAGWHPARTKNVLIEFLELAGHDDPRLVESLFAHLDDAVAESWRARTAFQRYPVEPGGNDAA